MHCIVAGDASSTTADKVQGELKRFCRDNLAVYQIPRIWRMLDQPLPRNAMGKINKKQLLKDMFADRLTN